MCYLLSEGRAGSIAAEQNRPIHNWGCWLILVDLYMMYNGHKQLWSIIWYSSWLGWVIQRSPGESQTGILCLSVSVEQPWIWLYDRQTDTHLMRREHCGQGSTVWYYCLLLQSLLIHSYTVYEFVTFAFSALALLVGCQEERPAWKNWVMRCWRGYLSGVKCKWFAYGPDDATATPSSLASLKSRLV